MIRVGLVGLSKMGVSHQAILGARPDVELADICDTNGYLLGILHKYTNTPTFRDFDIMLDDADLDAVVIATPTQWHAPMVRATIDHGVHVFCENPLCLRAADSRELAAAAEGKQLVTQVGYHNRFVATFAEVKRLVDLGAIGGVTHILAEAYGPVVLRQTGGTWRSRSAEGGGCLYDYAAHPINLVNWYMGAPTGVAGTVLNRVFSAAIDDEVTSTLHFPTGAIAQVSVSWADESVRKMTTRLTLWGTKGRIYADRQECQVYLRGEEYSAEIASFVDRCTWPGTASENTFASALITDRTLATVISDSERRSVTAYDSMQPAMQERQRRSPRAITRRIRRLVHR